MKAVIFAGGLGTRFSEATNLLPKPMIEIGNMPILWHIMKTYSHYGIKDFIICGGYKQYVIKEYFINYFYHRCDISINLANNDVTILDNKSEDWNVTVVDTGLNTMTGSRLKKVQKYLTGENFLLTYGDGVSDVDISESIRFHKKSKKKITMTVYKPSGRFGSVHMNSDSNAITAFEEKPDGDGNWINAGFFVCEPEVLDYLPADVDDCIFEKQPLQELAKDGKMNAYKHTGFWKPMDTLRDNVELNELWNSGKAPWKVWK